MDLLQHFGVRKIRVVLGHIVLEESRISHPMAMSAAETAGDLSR